MSLQNLELLTCVVDVASIYLSLLYVHTRYSNIIGDQQLHESEVNTLCGN